MAAAAVPAARFASAKVAAPVQVAAGDTLARRRPSLNRVTTSPARITPARHAIELRRKSAGERNHSMARGGTLSTRLSGATAPTSGTAIHAAARAAATTPTRTATRIAAAAGARAARPQASRATESHARKRAVRPMSAASVRSRMVSRAAAT